MLIQSIAFKGWELKHRVCLVQRMQPFHSLYYNILGYSSSPPKMAEQQPPLPPPINVHGGACTQSDVKEIAAPFPSFTALLAAAVAAEEEDFPPPSAPTTEQQIDHTITFHVKCMPFLFYS